MVYAREVDNAEQRWENPARWKAAAFVQEAEAARTQLRAASRDKGARAPPLNIVSIGDQLFERVASHAAARVSTLSPHIVADDVCSGMSASYLHGHGMPHP